MITDKIQILEKIALRIFPKDAYLKKYDAEQERNIIEEQKIIEKENKGKLPLITKYGEISIFTKIFVYIVIKIRADQELSCKDNNIDHQKDIFNIHDLLIFLDDKDNEKKHPTVSIKLKSVTQIEKDINKNEEKKEENINKFHAGIKRSYKDFCDKRSNKGFFKYKLFEKEKRLRLNKKAHTNILYHFSHLEFYNFSIPSKNRLYNLDFVLNCEVHETNVKYDLSCKKCYSNFYYFYNTYVIVYDLLTKYFYIPEIFSLPEKEIYVGYYLCKSIENNDADEKFSNKIINEYKIKQFNLELEALFQIENIENDMECLQNVKKIAKKIENDRKNNKKKDDDDLLKYNTSLKLKRRHKKFVVWNSIYLILLKKYPYFIKEIKANSVSNQVIDETKQEFGKNNFFKDFFIKMFDLEYNEKNVEEHKLDTVYIKQKLREYIAKTQTKIESFDLSHRSFYETEDKYLIDDNPIYNVEDNIPQNAYCIQKNKYNQSSMMLLVDIWKSWKNSENDDQFYIFFGYSK